MLFYNEWTVQFCGGICKLLTGEPFYSTLLHRLSFNLGIYSDLRREVFNLEKPNESCVGLVISHLSLWLICVILTPVNRPRRRWGRRRPPWRGHPPGRSQSGVLTRRTVPHHRNPHVDQQVGWTSEVQFRRLIWVSRCGSIKSKKMFFGLKFRALPLSGLLCY